MKQRVITFLVTILTILPALAQDFQVGDLKYNILTSTTAEVAGLVSSSPTTIEIPASVTYEDNSYKVTSIGKEAFYYCKSLTSITIPESVTEIGTRAFDWCTGLKSITIPDGVTTIGDYAFSGCTGLTSITIPKGVTTIGKAIIGGCSDLTSITVDVNNTIYDSRSDCNAVIEKATGALVAGCKKTVIPNSVTAIGDYAFYHCSGLTSINIPEGVVNIGSFAFSYCSALTSFVIPKNVTSIGYSVFGECSALTSIIVDPDNTVYDSRGDCNAIIKTETDVLVAGCKSSIIPEDVTSIGSFAFYQCDGLTSITIPKGVTSIGSLAFYDCDGLISIELPDGVTSIGDWAFEFSDNLAVLALPQSLANISSRSVLGGCNLTSLILNAPEVSYYDAYNALFSSMKSCQTIYVPHGSLSDYESNWSEYNFVEMPEIVKPDDLPVYVSQCDGSSITLKVTLPKDKKFAVYVNDNLQTITPTPDGSYTISKVSSSDVIKLSLYNSSALHDIYTNKPNKPFKTIQNGQIVIVEGTTRYDISGRKL